MGVYSKGGKFEDLRHMNIFLFLLSFMKVLIITPSPKNSIVVLIECSLIDITQLT